MCSQEDMDMYEIMWGLSEREKLDDHSLQLFPEEN